MICAPLAYTGAGVDLALLLFLAITCLVAGAIVLFWGRRRGRAAAVALLILISGTSLSITVGAPTPALASECSDGGTGGNSGGNDRGGGSSEGNDADGNPAGANTLTVFQTSVMDGLTPGSEPLAIAGVVANNGTDSTYITAVDVAITGVTLAPGAAPGVCDPADYFLVEPLMPVGRTVDPGASTTFAGASIDLRNTGVNQDACQNATVHLLYTANPG